MAVNNQEEAYNLGEHKIIDNVRYLIVRIVESTTLFEDVTLSLIYAEHELYVELRDSEGRVRFIQLSSRKVEATRAPGPIKGVKPYQWKVGLTNG